MVNPFSSEFLWGAATAAFQIEGASRADGKGASIWDDFCATPGKTVSGDTGDIACDHYHKWRQDIDLMSELRLRAYRFSVSWPRIFPGGRGRLSDRGLDFYNRLVDALVERQIVPFVTLYHWDLPSALQTELGGWAHADLPKIFADYAQTVFERLGDRVKYWLTINEPWVVVDGGYFHGVHAPGIVDRALGYQAGHNLLRAHAYAVERFRNLHPTGQIAFALNTSYSYPATESPADRAAAERYLLNFAGWFGDPVYLGDYPPVMRERLGDLLPKFSPADAALLKGSADFVALNYYFSEVIRHAPGAGPMDAQVLPQPKREYTQMNWPVTPHGFHDLLLWLHQRYGKPIYVTENGAAFEDTPDKTGFVHDSRRIAYLRSHIRAALEAQRTGVDLRGYFVWSLLDNLEWSAGFSKRFGLIRCDFQTLKRTIKASGRWYAKLIETGVPDD